MKTTKTKKSKVPAKAKKVKKATVKAVVVKKPRKTRKVSLAEVPDVIDQIIHRNQTPEQVVMIVEKKRGPKPKTRQAGEPHPVKATFGDPIGILVAKRVDYGTDGKVLTAEAVRGGAEVANSKVYIGVTRCNVNSGDKFDAASGRAIAMEQIGKMVLGESVTVAESMVPYIRPFRERAIRYFHKPYARQDIEVVTPSARGRDGFNQKMSYAEKQEQIRDRILRLKKEAFEAAEAALDAEALAKREARLKKKELLLQEVASTSAAT